MLNCFSKFGPPRCDHRDHTTSPWPKTCQWTHATYLHVSPRLTSTTATKVTTHNDDRHNDDKTPTHDDKRGTGLAFASWLQIRFFIAIFLSFTNFLNLIRLRLRLRVQGPWPMFMTRNGHHRKRNERQQGLQGRKWWHFFYLCFLFTMLMSKLK